MKYRLIGEVEIRKGFAELDTIKHTEVVEAPNGALREDLIDVSLNSFKEEQEPVWNQGYPLILPEPQERSGIAGEDELRSQVLLEALPYLATAQRNRFLCESLEYATGVTTTSLNDRGVRATVREVREFLTDVGYPAHKP